jgi:hypothetical protein
VGQESMKAFENKEFIASERWKCVKSPSGAHYWIIHSYDMTCKYCNNNKEINTNRFGWSRPEPK